MGHFGPLIILSTGSIFACEPRTVSIRLTHVTQNGLALQEMNGDREVCLVGIVACSRGACDGTLVER